MKFRPVYGTDAHPALWCIWAAIIISEICLWQPSGGDNHANLHSGSMIVRLWGSMYVTWGKQSGWLAWLLMGHCTTDLFYFILYVWMAGLHLHFFLLHGWNIYAKFEATVPGEHRWIKNSTQSARIIIASLFLLQLSLQGQDMSKHIHIHFH